MAKREAYKPSQRNYYSSSSEAYKVHPEHARPARPRPKRRKRVNRGVKYKYELGGSQHSLYIYSVLAMVFVACMALVFIVTSILDRQDSISYLQLSVRRAQQDNDSLRAELSERLDLSEIEEIARLRLGMQPPESHQIIRIQVENSTHIIQHDVSVASEDMGTRNNLLAILKDIFLGWRA